MIAIVKVGGSLLDWAGFPECLTGFLKILREREPALQPVLLGGGGPFADVVRHLDRVHHLGEVASHRLAIRSMDLLADVLGRLFPDARILDRLEDFDHALSKEFAILVPSRILDAMESTDPDPLPCCWDVTSDSIAAWIADRLDARSLILLKSASIAEGSTREDAARLGRVDPFFPIASRGIDRVEYVNLRDPGARAIELGRSRSAPP